MALGVARARLAAAGILLGAVALAAGLGLGAVLTGGASVPAEDSVDAGFARDMQVHHAQAVEMSVLVRDRSDDPDVRQVALDIELTQQQQAGQMYGWLAGWGLPQTSTLPVMGWMDHSGTAGTDDTAGTDHPGTDHADMAGSGMNPMTAMGLATPEQMAALEAAEGLEAERLYLQLMIPHHVGGIEMADAATEEASQPEVRRLARAMSTAQTAEVTALQQMLDERGGPVTS